MVELSSTLCFQFLFNLFPRKSNTMYHSPYTQTIACNCFSVVPFYWILGLFYGTETNNVNDAGICCLVVLAREN